MFFQGTSQLYKQVECDKEKSVNISNNFTSVIFRPSQNENNNNNNKNGCMEQSLKSVPVENSSGDIHLHTAFTLTSFLTLKSQLHSTIRRGRDQFSVIIYLLK